MQSAAIRSNQPIECGMKGVHTAAVVVPNLYATPTYIENFGERVRVAVRDRGVLYLSLVFPIASGVLVIIMHTYVRDR